MQWITDWRIGRRRGDQGRLMQVGIFGGIGVGRQVVVLHDDDTDRLHSRNIRTAIAQVDRSENINCFLRESSDTPFCAAMNGYIIGLA